MKQSQYRELISSVQERVSEAEKKFLEVCQLSWSIQGILEGMFLGKTISGRFVRCSSMKEEFFTIKVQNVHWNVVGAVELFGEHKEDGKLITEPFQLNLKNTIRIHDNLGLFNSVQKILEEV